MVSHFTLLLIWQSWPFTKKPKAVRTPSPGFSSEAFGLNIVSGPKNPDDCTNIVFVHGLGGSARGTWSHEVGSFWPAWLPAVNGLENCRIMTFGYDADWTKLWKPNNVLDISDFGKQLLEDLYQHYSNCGNVIFWRVQGLILDSYRVCCA
jgi:hypothetical protein